MNANFFSFSGSAAGLKAKAALATLVLSALCLRSAAQIPLVYTQENTGGSCTAPPLPAFSQLPAIQPLPDPFLWADGHGRSTNFSDWECRRNEIKAQIENYEIGTKPPSPRPLRPATRRAPQPARALSP